MGKQPMQSLHETYFKCFLVYATILIDASQFDKQKWMQLPTFRTFELIDCGAPR